MRQIESEPRGSEGHRYSGFKTSSVGHVKDDQTPRTADARRFLQHGNGIGRMLDDGEQGYAISPPAGHRAKGARQHSIVQSRLGRCVPRGTDLVPPGLPPVFSRDRREGAGAAANVEEAARGPQKTGDSLQTSFLHAHQVWRGHASHSTTVHRVEEGSLTVRSERRVHVDEIAPAAVHVAYGAAREPAQALQGEGLAG